MAQLDMAGALYHLAERNDLRHRVAEAALPVLLDLFNTSSDAELKRRILMILGQLAMGRALCGAFTDATLQGLAAWLQVHELPLALTCIMACSWGPVHLPTGLG